MRREEQNIESAGQDSFLDVTTNIVGILIVLVMVVGMRAQNPIVQTSPSGDPSLQAAQIPTGAELDALGKNATALEADVLSIAGEMRSVEREIDVHSVQREALATMIAAAEKDISDQRAKLDAAQQEDFDLRRQVAESKQLVDHGEAELDEIKSQKPPVEEIKHYPTPLSRTVLGHEVHFRLQAGRVSYVPFDELMESAESEIRRAGMELHYSGGKDGVVGPENGFELHYSVALGRMRGEGFLEYEAELVPVGMQEGETAEQAMQGRSDFQRILAGKSPHETTITLWVYPDSFGTYQRIKESLHKMGYATAARPLLEGELIGASNRGTHSSAQ